MYVPDASNVFFILHSYHAYHSNDFRHQSIGNPQDGDPAPDHLWSLEPWKQRINAAGNEFESRPVPPLANRGVTLPQIVWRHSM